MSKAKFIGKTKDGLAEYEIEGAEDEETITDEKLYKAEKINYKEHKSGKIADTTQKKEEK